jgi:hypothetical protein
MRALFPFVLLLACETAESEPKMAKPTGPTGPLILELFTSQGCSSCPPADVLLGKFAKDPQLAPLSFHVDYWNDLGWKDPYSLRAWTDRQHTYARALNEARVYTPELVIGGATGLVGSRASQVEDAIAKAPRPALLAATGSWKDNVLEVTTTAPPDAEVLVAVWEATRTIKVTRGENTGATLSNVRIVRKLEHVAVAGKQSTVRITLDPAWRDVGAVVFAQRPDKRIVASAFLPRS